MRNFISFEIRDMATLQFMSGLHVKKWHGREWGITKIKHKLSAFNSCAVNINNHFLAKESAHVHFNPKYIYLVVSIRATISPYNPSTSAKIRIRIIPTNSLGCCAVPLTPASPTMPIANPAASPDKPTERPAPK